jgi:hypothetical protein
MPAEEIFQLVGSFVYDTSLDLNMGYLHINLAQSARNILKVVMSFGFYKCTKLPMGVMPATDIFQSRTVSVFADMELDKLISYIANILISAGKTFKEHLAILEETLVQLGNTGFQVNKEENLKQLEHTYKVNNLVLILKKSYEMKDGKDFVTHIQQRSLQDLGTIQQWNS